MICAFVEEVLTICLAAAKWSKVTIKRHRNETVKNGRPLILDPRSTPIEKVEE
jgi:3-polyprenyl-4-hydroxybenzoate decarboxylase